MFSRSVRIILSSFTLLTVSLIFTDLSSVANESQSKSKGSKEYSVESVQALFDSVMTPPPLIVDPPARYLNRNRYFSMNCGIARTPGGRLWACWISGGDSADAYLAAAVSDDDGATWTEPRLVIDPTEAANGVKRRILIANFWTDPQGTLWLFFDYGLAMFDGRIGLWATRCLNPDAERPQWSKPERIANGSFHNRPLVMQEGTWMLPVELYARDYTKWNNSQVCPGFKGFPELDGERGISLLVSSDRGQSWKVRGRCYFPVSAGEEPVCLEKKDGTLWLLARTPKGMHQSFSTDRGKSWSVPVPAIKNPVTRFCVIRLQSGNLLLIRHGNVSGSETRRRVLTAVLSKDDGKTWQDGLVLDERNNVSYPDGFQTSDGRIFITYDRDRSGAAEILLAVFTEEDVAAGKPVSGKVKLKQLVTKSGRK